ncbi:MULTISPECIES: hypothetical protein [Phyllobacteriaceae]|uniref:hypothetical protein n=1 Tax=Phyllobacteriaceae TaxID=69277 RepID=UPI002ACA9C4C|nr:hypothetical protein [Chelativorans sp. M5D2P16]MDZ5698492.1 hypothetical protein [Chelativorans sp. M5D2P16]
MKFLLDRDAGQAAVRQIGSYLRRYGSGHHWVEKYRGDVFINVVEKRDEEILRNEFSDLVKPVDSDGE